MVMASDTQTPKSSVNFAVRARNPWFWVGFVGVLCSAIGASPETVQTWGDLWTIFITSFQNPFTVASMLVGILGVIIDPTTEGIGDSIRALGYKTPKR